MSLPASTSTRPVMNDITPNQTVSRGEYTAAFLLLRLFLGLRTLMAGLEKFEANKSYTTANYAENMNRMATGISNNSVIPLWAAKAFALPLGYMLVILGVA